MTMLTLIAPMEPMWTLTLEKSDLQAEPVRVRTGAEHPALLAEPDAQHVPIQYPPILPVWPGRIEKI
jgi:hypothetical protein